LHISPFAASQDPGQVTIPPQPSSICPQTCPPSHDVFGTHPQLPPAFVQSPELLSQPGTETQVLFSLQAKWGSVFGKSQVGGTQTPLPSQVFGSSHFIGVVVQSPGVPLVVDVVPPAALQVVTGVPFPSHRSGRGSQVVVQVGGVGVTVGLGVGVTVGLGVGVTVGLGVGVTVGLGAGV